MSEVKVGEVSKVKVSKVRKVNYVEGREGM